MRTISSIREMQETAEKLRRGGKIIGLVPTMGYLHKGHTSLIELAGKRADIVVTTIFVNPTQFGPKEDFTSYPRSLEHDTQLAVQARCDFLFVPSEKEIYPEGYNTYVTVEGLTNVLE